MDIEIDFEKHYAEQEKRYQAEAVERFAKIEEIYVGMPATMGIGSDSYAQMVVEIIRFKSGANAGKVRYVITEDAEWVDGVLVNRGNRNLRFSPNKYGYLRASSYRLSVGKAVDYRDPSF